MDTSPQWLPPQPVSEPIPPGPQPFVDDRPPLYKRILGPLAVVGALLVKFGKIAFIALKGAKFATTSLTMVVSIGAYTLIWGLPFALGFVALLFVHEMGHYIQLRREGVRPGRMIFVPFMGAVIGARSLGGSALAEARVGLAGPILGSLGALLVAVVAVATGSDMLRALAFTGFFLNLFNLLPVVPLDGGRAMAAMAPWMWFVGLGAVVTLVFPWPNPILILIAIFGGLEVYRRWSARKKGEEGNPRYYAVKPAHRLLVGAVYVGLIVALAVGMDLTQLVRDLSDV
ncbi:MAG: site-2 protease family protein [Solirubrobacteraceae bacterium]